MTKCECVYANAGSGRGLLPGGRGQHLGIRAEVAETDWTIVTDLTAEVVQILKKTTIQVNKEEVNDTAAL